MITPTIGRRVWLWPNGDVQFNLIDDQQPLDAGVIYVHDDRTVNLFVTDHEGDTHKLLRVTLLQDDDPAPSKPSSYATWMPYQKTQAEKPKPNADYRQRVRDEKDELDSRLGALNRFMDGEQYQALPLDERSRLAEQSSVMAQYSAILGDRIASFT